MLKLLLRISAGILCLVFIISCSPDGAWDMFSLLGDKKPADESDGDRRVTVTLQQGVDGYAGTKDTHVLEWNNTNNTGAHDLLEAARHTGITATDDKALLIQFDLSSIPSAATVIEADLALYLVEERNSSGTSKTLNLHKITESWIEGSGIGIDGQDVPGVDWLSMPTFDASSIKDKLIGIIDNQWYKFGIKSTVQIWIDNASLNHGVILREDTSNPNNGAKDFASSDHATVSWRPKLIMTYTD